MRLSKLLYEATRFTPTVARDQVMLQPVAVHFVNRRSWEFRQYDIRQIQFHNSVNNTDLISLYSVSSPSSNNMVYVGKTWDDTYYIGVTRNRVKMDDIMHFNTLKTFTEELILIAKQIT